MSSSDIIEHERHERLAHWDTAPFAHICHYMFVMAWPVGRVTNIYPPRLWAKNWRCSAGKPRLSNARAFAKALAGADCR